ncbi:Transcriptional regulator, LysR family [hydrothermal vent metagenome]|uniref:Transcriptional regulator, LysR family n=1 Tax=hydrothermal vent metagenome TaxID=652676 RepID=A0A3B0X1B9_9ZZZZ
MDVMSSMAVFRRVVEAKNFSAVARETNMSQSTVSKHIAALEERLGTKLLNRSTRSLKLTDAGKEYYHHCIRILNDFQEAEASIGKGKIKPTGTLRISTSAAFGRACMLPSLNTFFNDYPDIDLDVLFHDDYIDLVKEGIDLAIRIGPLADSSLIARKIGTSPRLVVASPEYLVKHGRPKKPGDLAKHNCLLYTLQKAPDLWYFNSAQEGDESVRVTGRLKASSPDAICDATVEGLGISILCEWNARKYIEDGRLKVILPDFHPTAYDINAVYPERKFVSQKVKQMIEFLKEAIPK